MEQLFAKRVTAYFFIHGKIYVKYKFQIRHTECFRATILVDGNI